MNSITEWLINEGIAHHIKHAENIIALLHLGELWNNKDYETIKQRARDYRKRRKETKDSRELCARYVLDGYFEWDCSACGARNPSTDTHCPNCGGHGLPEELL